MEQKPKRELIVSKEIKKDHPANVQDLVDEIFYKIEKMSPELQKSFEYSIAVQERAVTMDGEGAGKMVISPATIQLKMTPVKNRY
jgi:hypothetical protein